MEEAQGGSAGRKRRDGSCDSAASSPFETPSAVDGTCFAASPFCLHFMPRSPAAAKPGD
jgi:hypothetical protein